MTAATLPVSRHARFCSCCGARLGPRSWVGTPRGNCTNGCDALRARHCETCDAVRDEHLCPNGHDGPDPGAREALTTQPAGVKP